METVKLGKRNVVFRFPEMEINLLAVYGERRTYLCDTFLGPEPMELVKEVFRADGRDQPVMIFNSHHHWDHVWGNCAFPGPQDSGDAGAPVRGGGHASGSVGRIRRSVVLAHELCRARLERDFDEQLKANAGWARGEIRPRLPELVFSGRVVFADDGVEFFHSPGHTEDSASCLDRREGILFVGDSVEEPIPYLEDRDLYRYAATLEHYLRLDPAHYVAGHGRRFTRELIEENLAYVRSVAASLASGEELDTSGWSDRKKRQHEANLGSLRG